MSTGTTKTQELFNAVQTMRAAQKKYFELRKVYGTPKTHLEAALMKSKEAERTVDEMQPEEKIFAYAPLTFAQWFEEAKKHLTAEQIKYIKAVIAIHDVVEITETAITGDGLHIIRFRCEREISIANFQMYYRLK